MAKIAPREKPRGGRGRGWVGAKDLFIFSSCRLINFRQIVRFSCWERLTGKFSAERVEGIHIVRVLYHVVRISGQPIYRVSRFVVVSMAEYFYQY